MTDGREKPERLELAIHRSRLRPYLLIGVLLGAAFAMPVSLPLDAVNQSYPLAEDSRRIISKITCQNLPLSPSQQELHV